MSERLSEQKESSPEAARIVERVRDLAGAARVTCAWIIDMCLPDGAREKLEGCEYSLRDEVYHRLQCDGVRIVGEGEYAQAVRATNGLSHAVRPLRDVLRQEFGWDPPPLDAVKPKRSRWTEQPPSPPSPSVLFDLPPALEPPPAPPSELPAAPAEVKVPGTTDEIRARRRRIVELLRDRGAMTFDGLRSALTAEDGVLHRDMRVLKDAGLVALIGQRGAYEYRLAQGVMST